MSKICIMVLRCNSLTPDIFNRELHSLLEFCNLQIVCGIPYDEPLCDKYKEEDYLLLSISDDCFSDNCEMFLLPDNCLLNGKRNAMPFRERMFIFEKILSILLEKIGSLDLFIGDSGTKFDEFEEKIIRVSEFKYATMRLNTIVPPDLHFKLGEDE